MKNPKQQSKPSIKSQMLSKTIITDRSNGSKRVSIDFSKCTSRTKSEFARETNINNIVKLPLPVAPPLSYADLTNPPDLRQVFATIHTIKENFSQLPSDVRRLMNNDPAEMQSFIMDPQNRDFLISRGVLTKTPASTTPSSASQEPPEASKVPPVTSESKKA